MLLNIIHCLVYVLKHNVSETGLCLRPQVKPTLLGPIDRANPLSPYNYVHNLVNRAKIICQNQKDFNNEIKTIRHDLMLSEYPEEFNDSIVKTSTRNRLSSDTVYQGTVVIPYVKGISEKFRLIGNHFNLRTIFKTKHTLRGTLMKTGPVRDAQQTKQYVYSFPCDCSRCYIGETSRPLEVHNKEHKYNLTQGLR
jgi:hypothetical protein